MADSKADKNTVKPAANEKAETTVARESQDPLGQKEILAEGTKRDPQSDEAATGKVGFNFGDVNPTTATNAQLEKAEVDTSEADRIAALPDQNVYNPNAGLSPRVGGPYLDVVEMEQAEQKRAVFEGRQPDYNNMAGSTGVPLWTAGQLAAAHGGGHALAEMIEQNADNDKLGPRPVTKVPSVGENLEVLETAEAEKRQRREWDNNKVTSHDNPGVVFTDPEASNPATQGSKDK